MAIDAAVCSLCAAVAAAAWLALLVHGGEQGFGLSSDSL
jgi:hypothetical protein